MPNDDWENPNDPGATITRTKDGTTRMAYKAEHAVDLDSDIVVAATVHPGKAPDHSDRCGPSAADDQTARDSEIDLGHGLLAGCGQSARRWMRRPTPPKNLGFFGGVQSGKRRWMTFSTDSQ